MNPLLRWRPLLQGRAIAALVACALPATALPQLITKELPLIKHLDELPLPIALGDPDTPAFSGIEGPKGITEGDFRGDGSADDLAVSNLDGTVTVLLNDGHTFESPRHLRTGDPGAQTLRGILALDLDRDGDDDLLTAAPFEGKLFRFENLGDGAFAQEPTILEEGSANGVRNLTSGDFDGDGIQDLVVAGPGLGLRHLHGIGDGTFEIRAELPQLSPAGVRFPKPVYALEAIRNPSGRDDLAVIHAESDEIFILSTSGEEATPDGEEAPLQFEQALPPHTAETPLLITEFMAFNTRTLLDRFGEPSDWIEIYNRSNQTIDLRHWSLSDSLSEAGRWRFPAELLAPKSYLVVRASGKNQVVDDEEIHTSFMLSTNDDADREMLVLFEDNEVRQRIPSDTGEGFYPEQVPDISYGLAPNGAEQFFQLPSPGRLNNRGARSLGDIRLTEIIDYEVSENEGRTRIRVRFSDVSRLNLVWLATTQGGSLTWSMQAEDPERLTDYSVSLPSKFYDASRPPQVVARRKDGRVRPITIGSRSPDAQDGLRVVATLAARSAHTMDTGNLLSPRDDLEALPDLVLANRDTGHIEIRRGVPQFHRFDPLPREVFQVEGAPRSVRIADVDGDGFNDIVVALRNADKLMVLRNLESPVHGQRSFTLEDPLELAVGRSPREIAVIDANADGKDDAMVINRFSSDMTTLLTTPSQVAFGRLDHQYSIDGHVAALTVFDFNGDQRDDVVLTHRATGDFSVRLALEDGRLGPPEFHSAAETPSDTEFEDCDEDGEPDSITAEMRGQGSITVRLRDDNFKGGYGPATEYRSAAPVNDFDLTALISVSAADFNNDGHIDLSAAYFDCRHTFFKGNGDGTFEPRPVYLFADEPPDTIDGDLDGDDDRDLATVSYAGDIVIIENRDNRIMEYSSAEFAQARHVFPAPDTRFLGARAIQKIRLNDDPYDDLVVGTGAGVRVLLGGPSIADLSPRGLLEEEAVTALATGDFDNNGTEDVAAVCQNQSCITFLAMEDGELKPQISVPVPLTRMLATGYLDGDDELDLIGVGDVLWTALSSRKPRAQEEVESFTQREAIDGLVINEILAINDDIPIGVDFDKQADYVELYNGTSHTIRLWGMALMLDDGDERFRFPDKLLEPGQRQLLICSNNKRSPWHTGFKLPGSGGKLELENPRGIVLDTLEYGPQRDNIAFSRYRDGLPGWIFNPLPTPGLPNRDGGVVEPDLSFNGFKATELPQPHQPLRFTAQADDEVGIVSVLVNYRRLDLPNAPVQRFQLFDDGMHEDGELFDGTYSALMPESLPPGAEIEFYIEATDLTGVSITTPSDPDFHDGEIGRGVFSLAVGETPNLVISEVVRKNRVVEGGVEAGVDYVEIFNRGTVPLALDGVSLGQDIFRRPDDPHFNFPLSTTLLPGETILVYPGVLADGGGPYNAPFALDGDGGRLFLLGTAPHGARTLMDAVTYPELSSNRAHTRVGDAWRTSLPTPNTLSAPGEGTQIASNANGDRVVSVVRATDPGVRYQIEVSHDQGSSWMPQAQVIEATGQATAFHLPIELLNHQIRLQPIPPEPPRVSLESIATTQRTIEVGIEILESGGLPPNLTLFYGTTDAGANPALWSGRLDIALSQPRQKHRIANLEADTTYSLRLRATHDGGTVWTDALATRTASAELPLLGAIQLSGRTPATATLELALLRGSAAAASLTLFYGEEDGFTRAENWAHSQPSEGATAEGSVRFDLVGLRPGLTYTARAQARGDRGEVWSEAITFSTLSMLEALREYLVVTEFMYHPSPISPEETALGLSADDFEWIELMNRGPFPLDLRDVSLQNAVDFEFLHDSAVNELQPGEFTVVVANRSAFALRHPDTLPIAGQWCGPFNCKALSNDGIKENGEHDAIVVAYRQAETIAEIAYGDSGLWPRTADGLGTSLERVDPFDLTIDPSLPDAWQDSNAIGGSPGLAEPLETPLLRQLRQDLRLRTIAPYGNEFLEFTNVGDVTLDLSQVRIDVGVTFDFSGADLQELKPGQSLYVVRDRFDFEAEFGGVGLVAGEFDNRLRGEGEQLIISAQGITLLNLTYQTRGEEGWPLAYAIRFKDLKSDADPNEGSNWTGTENPVTQIQFGREGGVFRGTFSLSLSTNEPGANLEYQLDPSDQQGWQPYTQPLRIESSTVVTARAVPADGQWFGMVQTQAYIRNSIAARDDQLFIDTLGHPFSETEEAPAAIRVGVSEGTALQGSIRRLDTGTGEGQPEFLIRALDPFGNPQLKHIHPNLPFGSEWLLRAVGSDDLSLIRNAYFFELSRQLGLWAPQTVLIEVYLNEDTVSGIDSADFLGIYLLTETPNRLRLDLEPLRSVATDAPEITGGYLFRRDTHSMDAWTFPAGETRWEILEPSGLQRAQRLHQAQWLSQHLRAFTDAVPSSDLTSGYPAFIDVARWIDYHWIQFFALNVDGLGKHAHYHKDYLGKLQPGPVWDFRQSSGSFDPRTTRPDVWKGLGNEPGNHFFHGEAGTPSWWKNLFQDPDFQQAWFDRWPTLRAGVFSPQALSERPAPANHLDPLRLLLHFEKWPFEQPGYTSHADEVDKLIAWTRERAQWLDAQWLPSPQASPGEQSSHAGSVRVALSVETDAPIYYTLDGSDPRAPGGAPSPSARIYEDPFYLTETTTIIARTRAEQRTPRPNGIAQEWSASMKRDYFVNEEAASRVDLDLPNVLISEIMYHPFEPSPEELSSSLENLEDDSFEFIEFHNPSRNTVSLHGASLHLDASWLFTFGDDARIGPGQYAVLARNPVAFRKRYGDRPTVLGQYVEALPNGGALLSFYDRLNRPLAEIGYLDGGPWPGQADGSGPSLEWVGAPGEDPGFPANWRPSSDQGGTPGAPNSAATTQDPPNHYLSWQHNHFTPSQRNDPDLASMEADPDGDALPNLLEYALATDPWTHDLHPAPDVFVITPTLETILTFRLPHLPDDLEIEVESSEDLQFWEATRHFFDEDAEQNPLLSTVLRGPSRYARLRVSHRLP